MNGQVYDGELRLGFGYSRDMYRAETIEALVAAYKSELEELIAHCLSEDAGGLTPSDVKGLTLSEQELDAILDSI